MIEAVDKFFDKVRAFYYMVVLLGRRCIKCNGSLVMTAESLCLCSSCGDEFDPTVRFQRCGICGGVALLKVRRYYCRDCGNEIKSQFVFQTLPFEKEYFREKMAQSRQRKKQQIKRVREMLYQSRSQSQNFEAIGLDSVPGLLAALNGLTKDIDENVLVELKGKFDLERYQEHIKAYIRDLPIDLRKIPAIIENARKDLIWRFIAAIFLEHEHEIEINQQDQTIWVSRYADCQRFKISEGTEKADRLEGAAC